MQEIYYKGIFLILWLVMMAIRMPHVRRNKKNKNLRSEGKGREKFLVFLAGIGMTVVPFIWIFWDAFSGFNIGFPDWLRFVGMGLLIFSLWFFYAVHKELGRNWSPVLEIRKGHSLIESGPYKRVRHPMYTQMWLWVIAQLLLSSNWIVGGIGIATWAVLYFVRVPKEEAMMEEEFSEEYRDYKKRTGRIFPRF